jgi:carbohydrate kinase (thermoresistant glucokinase family)
MIVVVMGVSGCGKSTIARAIAEHFGWPFQEGDDLHPPANIAKMHAGQPLTDADRAPWLRAVAGWIDARLADRPEGDGAGGDGAGGVITCSLLKRAYRDQVIGGKAGVRLLYPYGSQALIAGRMQARHGHFMPASLLDSQFATLEPPSEEERPLRLDISGSKAATLAEAIALVEAAAREINSP